MSPTQNRCSKFYLCLLLQNLVILQTLIVAEKPQFSCFFIFGDSLVDNGNNNNLETIFKVNYLPYGIDFPTGPTGRFTNGLTIADFIGLFVTDGERIFYLFGFVLAIFLAANMLGFKDFIPSFGDGTTENILRGLNYGSGGSGILNETGSVSGDVFSFSEQIRNHEITISRIHNILGGKSSAKKHLSSCLYYVGFGTNDVLNYLPQLYSSATDYTPHQFSAILITQYSKQLRRLYENGARKVAIIELDKVGCTPLLINAYGSPNSSSCVDAINNIVQIFNRDLKLLIDNLNHDYPEAKFVRARYPFVSASSDDIKIISEPCCMVETVSMLCIEGSVPCSKRDEYRFWDVIHPTAAAVAAAANTTYNDISPLFLHNPIYLWESFVFPSYSYSQK